MSSLVQRGFAPYLAALSLLAGASLLALLVGEGGAHPRDLAAPGSEPRAVPRAGPSAAAPPPGPAEERVQGLWSRWPDRQHEGDPLRFYYFHGDGHGLYRYGRVGFTNTHSFDYRVSENTLVVTFRKSGLRHRLRYAVEVGRDGRRVLHLENDPEEDGVKTDYFFVPPPPAAHATLHTPADAAAAKGPPGRMWIELREFATGGVGFSLYQLGPAGIDGRGTGWHHRGDFDDWSTESLSYRIDAHSIALRFDLTGERATTPYGVVTGDDQKRRLVLHEDPRNWWQRATYTDMGRAFGMDLRAQLAFGTGALARGLTAVDAERD